MLVSINAKNRILYENTMRDMFKKRYSIFIEKLKCGLHCDHKNKIEKDQFDHDDAVYILNLDEHGEILGGLRLMPTLGNHMSEDVFSHLVDIPNIQPRGSNIWETSRLFTMPSNNNSLSTNTKKTMILLLKEAVQFALDNNIKKFVTVTDLRVERIYRSLHWPIKRLGLPKKDANSLIVMGTQKIHPSVILKFSDILDKKMRTDK